MGSEYVTHKSEKDGKKNPTYLYVVGDKMPYLIEIDIPVNQPKYNYS